METFSFSPTINLCEEGKWFLAVTSFEVGNSVFNINHENNAFSMSTQGHWSSRGGAETILKIQKLLELKSQNDFKIHVEEVRKTR